MEDLQLPGEKNRLIGWNGIRFLVPSEWEVIVNGPNHLLIEYDFRQIIEIRWEQKGPKSDKGVIKTLQKAIGNLVENEIRKVDLPKPFRRLRRSKNGQGVSWRADKQLSAIYWRYEHSRALFFCHLHDNPGISAESLVQMLDSIKFQQHDANAIWSIQDFLLHVPAPFSFSSYTIAPGLTRLAFKGGNVDLQFCRLAPASEKLSQYSLSSLLDTLQGKLNDPHPLKTTTTLFEHQESPLIPRQLLSRLRRKCPFRWGRIWYIEEMNRLLAVTAESIRPIDLETMHSLCTSYEILPKK